ncbi:hypothetical protein [Mesorhizobium sp. M7A.F.Ca.CA.004.08.1.1]|uniref:hypothetical protein n=1 Tax=Mesorhizobium sp. M7A.F.Ca.CA.004.08.1.1 TaxID=2496730 RepID=UPI001FDEF019|nr:hypothetical protein [Mesorhizobium sp. M7A.F.Ca.CA.004.08.1.1]
MGRFQAGKHLEEQLLAMTIETGKPDDLTRSDGLRDRAGAGRDDEFANGKTTKIESSAISHAPIPQRYVAPSP